MSIKPHTKIILHNNYGVCAIYERHPFRKSIISEAIGNNVDTGIEDDEWCWVYYDWCGNPVGLSDTKPEGIEVDKFTEENLGDKKLADYLNKPPSSGKY